MLLLPVRSWTGDSNDSSRRRIFTKASVLVRVHGLFAISMSSVNRKRVLKRSLQTLCGSAGESLHRRFCTQPHRFRSSSSHSPSAAGQRSWPLTLHRPVRRLGFLTDEGLSPTLFHSTVCFQSPIHGLVKFLDPRRAVSVWCIEDKDLTGQQGARMGEKAVYIKKCVNGRRIRSRLGCGTCR
jgi:hypothetical protein